MPITRRAPRRVRRDPEAARALILEAAKRVLAELGPDRAGLKAIARAAGVSHALVTHYFGTYDALVEAALEEQAAEAQRAILARLGAGGGAPAAGDLIDAFFEVLERPLHGRLIAWAMLTGRNTHQDFFARRIQGPRLVVDAIESRLRERFPKARIDRDELERLVLTVMAVGFGSCLGQGVLWEAFGHRPSAERDKHYRRWLGELVRSRIEAMIGEKLPDG